MKLTTKQVKHTAKLARLGLNKKEEKKFQKELSSILDFVEKLNELNTDKIEPTAHITGLENVVREDNPWDKNEEQRKKLLELSPDLKDKYIKVKHVF